MVGFERFSNYKGYGNTFEFTGTHEDETPIDPDSMHRLSKLVAIDAIRVRAQGDQYSERWILREPKKGYVGVHSEA